MGNGVAAPHCGLPEGCHGAWPEFGCAASPRETHAIEAQPHTNPTKPAGTGEDETGRIGTEQLVTAQIGGVSAGRSTPRTLLRHLMSSASEPVFAWSELRRSHVREALGRCGVAAIRPRTLTDPELGSGASSGLGVQSDTRPSTAVGGSCFDGLWWAGTRADTTDACSEQGKRWSLGLCRVW